MHTFVAGKFAHFFFRAHEERNEPQTLDSAHQLLEEAQLFWMPRISATCARGPAWRSWRASPPPARTTPPKKPWSSERGRHLDGPA